MSFRPISSSYILIFSLISQQVVPVGHEGRTADDVILRIDIQEEEDMRRDLAIVVCNGSGEVLRFVH